MDQNLDCQQRPSVLDLAAVFLLRAAPGSTTGEHYTRGIEPAQWPWAAQRPNMRSSWVLHAGACRCLLQGRKLSPEGSGAMLRRTAGLMMAAGLLGAMAFPVAAAAAPPAGGPQSNGVGACIRGFATNPEQFNVDQFGTGVSAIASSTKGAGVLMDLESIRSEGC